MAAKWQATRTKDLFPAFIDGVYNTLQRVVLLSMDLVAAVYKSGTYILKDLKTNEQRKVEIDEPIVEFEYSLPYIVTMHNKAKPFIHVYNVRDSSNYEVPLGLSNCKLLCGPSCIALLSQGTSSIYFVDHNQTILKAIPYNIDYHLPASLTYFGKKIMVLGAPTLIQVFEFGVMEPVLSIRAADVPGSTDTSFNSVEVSPKEDYVIAIKADIVCLWAVHHLSMCTGSQSHSKPGSSKTKHTTAASEHINKEESRQSNEFEAPTKAPSLRVAKENSTQINLSKAKEGEEGEGKEKEEGSPMPSPSRDSKVAGTPTSVAKGGTKGAPSDGLLNKPSKVEYSHSRTEHSRSHHHSKASPTAADSEHRPHHRHPKKHGDYLSLGTYIRTSEVPSITAMHDDLVLVGYLSGTINAFTITDHSIEEDAPVFAQLHPPLAPKDTTNFMKLLPFRVLSLKIWDNVIYALFQTGKLSSFRLENRTVSEKKIFTPKTKQEIQMKSFHVNSSSLVAYADGEKSAVYFFNLLPKQVAKNIITKKLKGGLTPSLENSFLSDTDVDNDTTESQYSDSNLKQVTPKEAEREPEIVKEEPVAVISSSKVNFTKILLEEPTQSCALTTALYSLLKSKNQSNKLETFCQSIVSFHVGSGLFLDVLYHSLEKDLNTNRTLLLHSWSSTAFVALLKYFFYQEGTALLHEFLQPLKSFRKQNKGQEGTFYTEIISQTLAAIPKYFQSKSHIQLQRVCNMVAFKMSNYIPTSLAMKVILEILLLHYLIPELKRYCYEHSSSYYHVFYHKFVKHVLLSTRFLKKSDNSLQVALERTTTETKPKKSEPKITRSLSAFIPAREVVPQVAKASQHRNSFPVTKLRSGRTRNSDKRIKFAEHKTSERFKAKLELPEIRTPTSRVISIGKKTVRKPEPPSPLPKARLQLIVLSIKQAIHGLLLPAFDIPKWKNHDQHQKTVLEQKPELKEKQSEMDILKKEDRQLFELIFGNETMEAAMGNIRDSMMENMLQLIQISFKDTHLKAILQAFMSRSLDLISFPT
eukprot:TRINITY_DN23483_c0_g1_i1.p1 TRINITY_DN23483_c0_g1~~TRINITY_DN23483_c0_g1_i1.p1  ORF type:complete len:1043 (-),score=230.76 TRINITY_DN23483_c0_g1_i1:63-3164(-)